MRTFDSLTAFCRFDQAPRVAKVLARPACRKTDSIIKLRREVASKLAYGGLIVLLATCAAFTATLAAENIMIQEDNMKELNCSLPNEKYRLLSTNAPGQVFVGDEKVNLKLAFKKGNLAGRVPFLIEIQEIGTRTPGRVVAGMTGWNDTSGKAPRFDVIGTPVNTALAWISIAMK